MVEFRVPRHNMNECPTPHMVRNTRYTTLYIHPTLLLWNGLGRRHGPPSLRSVQQATQSDTKCIALHCRGSGNAMPCHATRPNRTQQQSHVPPNKQKKKKVLRRLETRPSSLLSTTLTVLTMTSSMPLLSPYQTLRCTMGTTQTANSTRRHCEIQCKTLGPLVFNDDDARIVSK